MTKSIAPSGKASAVVLAILAGASFGVGGAISQIVAAAGFSVMQVCFGQYVFALAILGILVALKFRPTTSPKEAAQLVVLGAVSSISTFTYYLAIDMLSVNAAVAIQFQYVWIAVAFQAIFERKFPGKWTILSAALIVVGTFFGSGMADEMLAGGLTMSPLGLLCAIVCAVFYALFIYMNGRIATDHHPVPRTFFEVIGGALLASVLMPLNGGFAFDFIALALWGSCGDSDFDGAPHGGFSRGADSGRDSYAFDYRRCMCHFNGDCSGSTRWSPKARGGFWD